MSFYVFAVRDSEAVEQPDRQKGFVDQVVTPFSPRMGLKGQKHMHEC